MQQRRTPSGQRPARRPAAPGRLGGARGGARDFGVRTEARGAATRVPRAGRVEAVRSANRPAAARRAAASGSAKRMSAPRSRHVTGRATVLFAVLIALALAYTYPVRVYLNQQADIERMEASQAAQRKLIAKLSAEAASWQDPNYIRIQARQRFYMGEPGEVLLVVLDDPEGAARDAAGGRKPAPRKQNPSGWHDTLWSSIKAANEEQAGQ